MGIIKAKQLVHEYIRRDEEGNVESIQTALDHVDLDVKQGDFIAILGHNGSGKSTLAKHINALLAPSEGSLFVDGMDVSKEENGHSGAKDRRNGFPESGQSDHCQCSGGGCRIRTGKYRCADR